MRGLGALALVLAALAAVAGALEDALIRFARQHSIETPVSKSLVPTAAVSE